MSEAKRTFRTSPNCGGIESPSSNLRRHLNGRLAPGAPALTYLPFLALALVRVLQDFPDNAMRLRRRAGCDLSNNEAAQADHLGISLRGAARRDARLGSSGRGHCLGAARNGVGCGARRAT